MTASALSLSGPPIIGETANILRRRIPVDIAPLAIGAIAAYFGSSDFNLEAELRFNLLLDLL